MQKPRTGLQQTAYETFIAKFVAKVVVMSGLRRRGAKSACRAMPGAAMIWIYRHTPSPLVGFNCRHLPTCSVYGDEAIGRFGLWRGGWMTLARLPALPALGHLGNRQCAADRGRPARDGICRGDTDDGAAPTHREFVLQRFQAKKRIADVLAGTAVPRPGIGLMRPAGSGNHPCRWKISHHGHDPAGRSIWWPFSLCSSSSSPPSNILAEAGSADDVGPHRAKPAAYDGSSARRGSSNR